MNDLIALIILAILLICLIVGGIYFLIKYKKTKEKKYLIIGLILTLVFIGILVYIFIGIPSTQVDYAPAEIMLK